MNNKNLKVPQFDQETSFSCIPACLQQVFGCYEKQISQKEILKSLKKPKRGMSIPKAGTFVKRYGFNSLIITNNIHIFDPTWFKLNNIELINNLKKRRRFVDKYNQSLIDDYLEYLKANGQLKFDTISLDLFIKYLSINIPIIVELASTFLYRKSKAIKTDKFNDSIKGKIEGHGVVIAGFNKNKLKVVDPNYKNNPFNERGIYWIRAEDLIASIFILEGKSLLLIQNNKIEKKD